MQTFVDLLLIQVIVALVMLSGFIDSFKSMLKFTITRGVMSGCDYSLKPFDCNLCLSFWCSIIYLFCTGYLCLHFVALALTLSYLNDVIMTILVKIRDILLILLGE